MSQQTRYITVGSIQPYYRPKHLGPNQVTPSVPWIRMQGHWLTRAGFGIGANIKIQVAPGRLIMTRVDNNEEANVS